MKGREGQKLRQQKRQLGCAFWCAFCSSVWDKNTCDTHITVCCEWFIGLLDPQRVEGAQLTLKLRELRRAALPWIRSCQTYIGCIYMCY